MNSATMWIWIGAYGGGAIGVAGGIYGIYCSIKNTDSKRERQFTIKASVVCVIAVLLFITLRLIIPSPRNNLLWIPYSILLPISILYWNKKQTAIREEETQNIKRLSVPLSGH